MTQPSAARRAADKIAAHTLTYQGLAHSPTELRWMTEIIEAEYASLGKALAHADSTLAMMAGLKSIDPSLSRACAATKAMTAAALAASAPQRERGE